MIRPSSKKKRTKGDAMSMTGLITGATSVYDRAEPLSAADIAETIFWAVDRPAHVNINRIEIMPVCQSFGPLVIVRN
jgi:NADP-dependent 3-hydroxy acid dehydrogenase YdfG